MDGKFVIGALVFVLLVAVFAPVVVDNIANANNQYECLDDVNTIQSADLLLCTNASYACCGTLKTLNVSFDPPLCTNASGVGVANQSACAGFLAYNVSATHVGTSTTENVLLGLVMLFLVLATIYGIVTKSGMLKSK